MRVVIMADRRFAARESSMLARLEVGLADEGVRVIHALPSGVPLDAESAFVRSLHFDQAGLPLSLGWRASSACRSIVKVCEEIGGGAPEVVHVFGGSVWDFGYAIADRLGAALVVDAWRSGLARMVPRLVSRPLERHAPIVLSPDRRLADYLQREAPAANIRCAPWGVYVPDQPREVLRKGRAWSIMLAGAGLDRAAYAATFEALADSVRARPDILLFADAVSARRAELWQLAAKLGVRSQLSLVDEMDANRELVLQGDVLVLPEARGEQRTLVLEAMGQGMPVIAAEDPLNGCLRQNETARLVPSGDRRAWREAVEHVLGNPDYVRELAESARSYLREEHRSTRQVGCVIDAYETAVGKEPIPFPG